MASAARIFSRIAARASIRPSASQTARNTLLRRGYATGPSSSSGSGKGLYIGLGAAALAGGVGYYVYSNNIDGLATKANTIAAQGTNKAGVSYTAKESDYQNVYNAIAKKLADEDDYDDGSYGPVLLRLGWHASGTYDALTKTGGSNGATMRFAPEGDHGANAGLKAARDFLEPVKEQFPWITYSDLWTLAAVCAIQEMHGPTIQWRPGRSDRDVSFCTPDGRLPDASKSHDHLRAIFGRMGFNDQEIVALSGAHALGRCHTDRSGFEGPWTFSPTIMTNDYFKLLMGGESDWQWRKWNGPKQYEDKGSKTLMMLPTDMAIVKDESFRKTAERYAADNEVFFSEFSEVICKLFELGVPFETQGSLGRMRFKGVATAE